MRKKIFCKFCKHHGGVMNEIVSRECYHPKNLVDNWFDEKFDTIHMAYAINKNNECEWFEPREEEMNKHQYTAEELVALQEDE